jgi:hypothetical protein
LTFWNLVSKNTGEQSFASIEICKMANVSSSITTYGEYIMAKQANKLTTEFDVNISCDKGDGLALTKTGSIHLNARVSNPDYEKGSKEGRTKYKTRPMDQLFDFAVMNEDGVVSIQTPYLNKGDTITFYPASFTPKD